ncbi:Receptor-like protein kinase [Thalictrum thalictroides]|uniref:Receptor-like protein kinase n=1 Tax=Thalictrum thalictroides TaxID=46969 RepID=A0A7J6WE59_THATH|nr:Receptor-like protein kinase [Thalictrum thalictroides]
MKKKLSFFSFLVVLFFSFSSSNSDFQALMTFKASSDRSNSLYNWSNSTHPCSWLGVTCNSNTTQVTRLVLQNLNLSGSIQVLTQLTHLRLLSLKYNNLSSFSSLPLDFSSWKNLKLLYLSHNQFSGNFPSGIDQLRRLRRIDLSYNRFSGEIPSTPLSQLSNLLTLQLESNEFTGFLHVYSQVESFVSLIEFNVSENKLSGEIPKPFSLFPSSSFTGNKNLCGKPLLKKCFNETVDSDPLPVEIPTGHGRKKISFKAILLILLIDVGIVAFIALGIFFCCRTIKRRKQKREIKKEDNELKKSNVYEYGRQDNEELVFFEGSKQYKVDELLKASAEMLGKGSIGTTYKAVMVNGDVVVVKRARKRRKKKEVEGLLQEIGRLRHSNLVSLRAYYCSKDELLFVYDYFPKGSLHSLLHGNRGPGRTPLDWTTRLKFALGVAEGLVYLHNASKSKLSHGHLTSSNVVIDEEGNAHLSDFALHQLLVTAAPTNTEYKAPELMLNTHNSRKFSQKGDVYSFGVILLEILTGKMAMGEGETSLVKWVQSVVREEWTSEVFDFELLRYKEMEEEMVALLQLALLCLAPKPHNRPKISIVHKMIKDIRLREWGEFTNSPTNDRPSDSSLSLSEGTPTTS